MLVLIIFDGVRAWVPNRKTQNVCVPPEITYTLASRVPHPGSLYFVRTFFCYIIVVIITFWFLAGILALIG